MKMVITIPLSDESLQEHLDCGDTILFAGVSVDWHEIERRVERLCFGEAYIVCAAQGGHRKGPTVSVKPLACLLPNDGTPAPQAPASV
jgi:hypothetical protein